VCPKGQTGKAAKYQPEELKVTFQKTNLTSLAPQASSKLVVLGLNGDTLGMDCTQVGIFEQADKVGLD